MTISGLPFVPSKSTQTACKVGRKARDQLARHEPATVNGMADEVLLLLGAQEPVLHFYLGAPVSGLQGGDKNREGQDSSDFCGVHETHNSLRNRWRRIANPDGDLRTRLFSFVYPLQEQVVLPIWSLRPTTTDRLQRRRRPPCAKHTKSLRDLPYAPAGVPPLRGRREAKGR